MHNVGCSLLKMNREGDSFIIGRWEKGCVVVTLEYSLVHACDAWGEEFRSGMELTVNKFLKSCKLRSEP